MTDEINKLKEEISNLERDLFVKNNQLRDLVFRFQMECTHPVLENECEYIEGTYYDREEYHTTPVCTRCGFRFATTINKGGYG